MNGSYVVASVYRCEDLKESMSMVRPDPIWRTTVLGCNILEVLQEMYHFQMTYTYGYMIYNDNGTFGTYAAPPDIYARPLPFHAGTLDYAFPIELITNRRSGFLLRRIEAPEFRTFFSLPFSAMSWSCLLITVLVLSLVLQLLSCWESRVLPQITQEYSFAVELLVVLGACCQHIPPVSPILLSRRTAYFTLFCFAYLVYSFYTSNLLSHLVNDKKKPMTLTQLVESDYEFITLNNVQLEASRQLTSHYTIPNFQRIDLLREKLSTMKYLNVTTALQQVGEEKVALLSDYITLYPYIGGALNNDVICSLTEINLFTNVKEYFFTSKTFPLQEQFKIGILRMKETGVLQRIKGDILYRAPQCQHNPVTYTCLLQVLFPFLLLGCGFLGSFCTLFVERYCRNTNASRTSINNTNFTSKIHMHDLRPRMYFNLSK